MKQLELQITIEQNDEGKYEAISIPINPERPKMFCYTVRKTWVEALRDLIIIISDKNTRYWFIMEEK